MDHIHRIFIQFNSLSKNFLWNISLYFLRRFFFPRTYKYPYLMTIRNKIIEDGKNKLLDKLL